MSPTMKKLTNNIIETIAFSGGFALLAFNIVNYNFTKSGVLYYKDPAQYGVAIGAFLIALAFMMRRWR